MMVKKSVWLIVFVLLMGFADLQAHAWEIPESPIPLYPGATIRSNSYNLYARLPLQLTPQLDGKSELTPAGNLWEMWVTCPEENQVIKTHYMEMARKHGAVLSNSGINDLQFRYDQTRGPVYVKFHAQNGKYSMKILQPAALHSQVVFGDGKYAERKADDSPEPPLITDYPLSQCIKFIYNDFNKLELSYKKDGKNVKKTFEGRYWQKSVMMKDSPDRPRGWVSPTDISETMRAAVLASGGEVLSGENRELVFHISGEEAGEIWATLWPQDGKYTLKIINQKAMDQVLVFDADTMMARLNALGVLTLDGIYFDTAEATLKPESDEALQAALKLMTDYSELVIEVGGHTDNVGKAADNETLSMKRASSVRGWLINAGIEEKRLEARGYGEGSPVADNETKSGRAVNRRVELKKLSGGKVRGVMTLIKPYPGSQDIGSDEKRADYKVNISERRASDSLMTWTATGTGFRQHYQVLDDEGKKDTKLSGVQIRHNYIQAVESFGGTILAEESHGLYFRLDNLDGTSTYVAVWAPGSKYHVTAVTTPAP